MAARCVQLAHDNLRLVEGVRAEIYRAEKAETRVVELERERDEANARLDAALRDAGINP